MRIFSYFTALVFPLFISLPIAADEDANRATIEGFHKTLIAVMQSDADFESRYATLLPAVSSAFDLDTVSRMSLGSPWRKLDDESRTEFRALMEQLIVSTYAERFDSYNDQHFEITLVSEPRPGRWLVRTLLHRKNDKPVSLDYYFKGVQVFNVVADGVSDLAVRRADYTAVVNEDGYAGLADSVREKIVGLRDGS